MPIAQSDAAGFVPDARLTVDLGAIKANWRAFAAAGGAADCGAAIKADGYGLGVREVAGALVAAGCRDLFVEAFPLWREAVRAAG